MCQAVPHPLIKHCGHIHILIFDIQSECETRQTSVPTSKLLGSLPAGAQVYPISQCNRIQGVALTSCAAPVWRQGHNVAP